jgi:hypothetical protein
MATESKKARLREQRDTEKCRIDDFCYDHSIEKVEITEYQIRLNGWVDVYPTNKKYCLLNGYGGKWGRYDRIEELLDKIKRHERDKIQSVDTK